MCKYMFWGSNFEFTDHTKILRDSGCVREIEVQEDARESALNDIDFGTDSVRITTGTEHPMCMVDCIGLKATGTKGTAEPAVFIMFFVHGGVCIQVISGEIYVKRDGAIWWINASGASSGTLTRDIHWRSLSSLNVVADLAVESHYRVHGSQVKGYVSNLAFEVVINASVSTTDKGQSCLVKAHVSDFFDMSLGKFKFNKLKDYSKAIRESTADDTDDLDTLFSNPEDLKSVESVEDLNDLFGDAEALFSSSDVDADDD